MSLDMTRQSASQVRHLAILHSIVQTYIETGEPVASRTVARRLRENLSPATVRNIMADLYEEGYLAQPHTSAGRIPTEKAFQSYVHSLDTTSGSCPQNWSGFVPNFPTSRPCRRGSSAPRICCLR